MLHSKLKVAVMYGGNSCEHDVSCMTAKSILKHIDREKFEVLEIFVGKDGRFNQSFLQGVDVAFLAFHGENYEDGKFQKILESHDIKYTGPGVEASRINMDKIEQKKYFQKAGLGVANYIEAKADDEINKINDRISKEVFYPCFVKPISAGSSIAVSKVGNKQELKRAIVEAGKINNRIIIESAVANPRELEVGVLGNDELTISEPGEVLSGGEFYSYETKYFKPFETTTEAKNLSKDVVQKIKDWAEKSYKTTGCRGYSRIDFFLDQNNELYINEINTLPGFTAISMYPKLMEASGISYRDLISKIIELALK